MLPSVDWGEEWQEMIRSETGMLAEARRWQAGASVPTTARDVVVLMLCQATLR